MIPSGLLGCSLKRPYFPSNVASVIPNSSSMLKTQTFNSDCNLPGTNTRLKYLTSSSSAVPSGDHFCGRRDFEFLNGTLLSLKRTSPKFTDEKFPHFQPVSFHSLSLTIQRNLHFRDIEVCCRRWKPETNWPCGWVTFDKYKLWYVSHYSAFATQKGNAVTQKAPEGVIWKSHFFSLKSISAVMPNKSELSMICLYIKIHTVRARVLLFWLLYFHLLTKY